MESGPAGRGSRDGEQICMGSPFFDLPLNLPHAGTVAARIWRLIDVRAFGADLRYLRLADTAERIEALLRAYRITGEDPDAGEAEMVRHEAAALGRELVDQIAALGLGEDRLGQCVRNLFECLAMGAEGAEISLRAGENPHSLQRPA
jgi:hypothetical protein